MEIEFSTSSDRFELIFLIVPSFSNVLDLADAKQNIQLNAIRVVLGTMVACELKMYLLTQI